MVKEFKHKKLTWIDLDNPTQEEVRELATKYGVDALTSNELLSPTIRPRVDYHDNYIYLILHFPNGHNDVNGFNKKIEEVDFIIGKDFIITTHYTNIDALLEFSKIFEVESILDKSNMAQHAGYIFFYMIQNLYKNLENRLDHVRDILTDIENQIFSGNERQMVQEVSKLNRLLLNYRESTDLHQEILESFEVAGKKFFGKDFEYHLRSITGEYYKVRSSMDSAKEYLNELRDTNDSLLSTKQNEVMKILTITNFIFLPLALLAGIFGMNTKNMPIIGHPNDFWVLTASMIVIATVLFLYFKVKKWL
jgi:magnesium transporter